MKREQIIYLVPRLKTTAMIFAIVGASVLVVWWIVWGVSTSDGTGEILIPSLLLHVVTGCLTIIGTLFPNEREVHKTYELFYSKED